MILCNLSIDEVALYLQCNYKAYLPEWAGYWFGSRDATGNYIFMVYDRNGNYHKTPHLKYMIRNDWTVEPLTSEEYEMHKIGVAQFNGQ